MPSVGRACLPGSWCTVEHTGGVLSSMHPRVGCSATQKGPRFLGQTPGSSSPCRGLESPAPVTSPPLGLFPYCCSGNRLMVHRRVNGTPAISYSSQVSALRWAVRAALPRGPPTPHTRHARVPECLAANKRVLARPQGHRSKPTRQPLLETALLSPGLGHGCALSPASSQSCTVRSENVENARALPRFCAEELVSVPEQGL